MNNRITKKQGEFYSFDAPEFNNYMTFAGQQEYLGSLRSKALEKLGKLEDVEEELGIDLITLFKALKQNYVWVKTNAGIEKNKGFSVCGLVLWSQIKLNPKDYGKTWALDINDLTEEELE